MAHLLTTTAPRCEDPAECVETHCRVRVGGTSETPRLCLRHTGGRVACHHCEHQAYADLTAIGTLVAALPEQALEGANRHGRLLAAQRLPGGDALALVGPWADPGDRERLIERIEAGLAPDLLDDAVAETPGECLTAWARSVREVRGESEVWRESLDDARAYLARHLTWAAVSFDGFPTMALELRAQVRMLESVLGAGQSVTRSQVPCPACGIAALAWEYGSTEEDDGWQCSRPSCGEWVSPEDHGALAEWSKRYAGEHAWVTVADAAVCIDRHEHRLRRWIAEGLIRARTGRGGVMEVAWADVVAVDAERPRRARRTPATEVA